ncbi:MAG: inositol monophosphatase [Kordiimonadaceae bacterium]|jgi:myo-inositol-1(or 4)-monophosphatase|nr:inositol monophosphatase [Kordiimonadaceae bacterium]MBT6032460.1 inositol monophosphatase [Kordiimonadaceae bacterium]
MALQSAIINVMEKAVKKASIRLVRDFNEVEHLQVSRKGPADFVSRADVRTERTIVEELKVARPGFGFILEEGEDTPPEDATKGTWIIDPIDGTTNFLHSIPHFAISVALEKEGEIVAGIVYNPVTDELFWAEKGRGAFVGNRKLTVSSRKNLDDCVLATGIPFMGKPNLGTFPAQLDTIMPKVAGIRRFGSAALDLAFVAAGRYDGFWEENLQPWDIAAGILIVREARGMVSEFDGRAKVMQTGQILATNGSIHGSVTRLLSEARKINRAKQI